MAIDPLQANTPVLALHDAPSSAHAVLRLWQLPGPAQPTGRAALLAAGAPLHPLWRGSLYRPTLKRTDFEKRSPPLTHPHKVGWDSPLHPHRAAPTARSALAQKVSGTAFQGIYTTSRKSHKKRIAAATQPGNLWVMLAPGDKSPATANCQENNNSCQKMILLSYCFLSLQKANTSFVYPLTPMCFSIFVLLEERKYILAVSLQTNMR